MAGVSGTELSQEKETEIELKKRQKRPWEDFHLSGKIGITPELPETLGFFDISAVKREQQELSAGNHPSLTRFICAELTRGYFLEHNEAKYTERRERVYTCMRIPKELEKVVCSNDPELLPLFLHIHLPVCRSLPYYVIVSLESQLNHVTTRRMFSSYIRT
ncbi:hypothetical protein GOODEAATRI_022788 [Goodea atripinnis]|uniref:Uncharacterized protein n=1 Tax=Goodea atripinnis TaxID=208336 RepID=A0ABV0NYQ8_9TELE